VYSWSLFTQPLIASFGWSNSTTTWAFALAIFFLGVGAIIGGRWQDRRGPRIVAITGAALWGIGNLLAGLGTAGCAMTLPEKVPLNAEAANVEVLSEPPNLETYEPAGEVTAHVMGRETENVLRQGMNQLRNQAAAKGATFVAVDDDSGCDLAPVRAHAYEPLLAEASPARAFGQRSGEDLYILYTGGTTGMPRGVMWRHEDVFFAGLQGGNPGGPPIESADQLAANAKARPYARTFLPAAPFIHGAAQWAALIGMFGGGKVVLIPGRSFDARQACTLIATEKAEISLNLTVAIRNKAIDAYKEIMNMQV
jgi:hypothetical protein